MEAPGASGSVDENDRAALFTPLLARESSKPSRVTVWASGSPAVWEAAVVPSLPRTTVRVLPLTAVTRMTSDPQVTSNGTGGNRAAETTGTEVTESLIPEAR